MSGLFRRRARENRDMEKEDQNEQPDRTPIQKQIEQATGVAKPEGLIELGQQIEFEESLQKGKLEPVSAL